MYVFSTPKTDTPDPPTLFYTIFDAQSNGDLRFAPFLFLPPIHPQYMLVVPLFVYIYSYFVYIVYETSCISSQCVCLWVGCLPTTIRPRFRWYNVHYTTGAVWYRRDAQERNSQECNIWAIDVCKAHEPPFPSRNRRFDASMRVLRPYIWNLRYVSSDIDILCLDIVCLLVCYIRILISYVWNIILYLCFTWILTSYVRKPDTLMFIWTLTSYLHTVPVFPKCLHLDIEILYPTFVTPICYILDIDIR